MSIRDARIDLAWADGDYTFRLGWGELVSLQEKSDAGPYVILNRLQTHAWLMEDIAGVIQYGLEGGGLKPMEATKLVKRYVRERPPLENHPFAVAILTAGLIGATDEVPGETDAEKVETNL